jgi:hypothetical protein
MARPKWFSDLQGLRYDWQVADKENAAEAREQYEQAILEASRMLNCSLDELKQVLRRDFAAWIKEEGLPKIRRQEPDLPL